MTIVWTDTLDTVDWNELSDLYRKAPLGEKSPERLKTVFANSMFRRFAYEDGVLVAAGRALADGLDCSYICDVAILPSHQGRGLGNDLIGQLVDLWRVDRQVRALCSAVGDVNQKSIAKLLLDVGVPLLCIPIWVAELRQIRALSQERLRVAWISTRRGNNSVGEWIGNNAGRDTRKDVIHILSRKTIDRVVIGTVIPCDVVG